MFFEWYILLFTCIGIFFHRYLSDVELLPVIGKLHPSESYYAKQQADYIISQVLDWTSFLFDWWEMYLFVLSESFQYADWDLSTKYKLQPLTWKIVFSVKHTICMFLIWVKILFTVGVLLNDNLMNL